MFGAIKKLAKKVKKLNQDKMMKEILKEETLRAQILDLNLNQMLSGEGADDESLPRYEDDPYFKTKEAALRYRDWKINISPDKTKDKDVMDFYITGQFHSTLHVKGHPEGIQITSDSEIISSVKDKAEALGLNSESKKEILPEIKESLIEDIKKAISS